MKKTIQKGVTFTAKKEKGLPKGMEVYNVFADGRFIGLAETDEEFKEKINDFLEKKEEETTLIAQGAKKYLHHDIAEQFMAFLAHHNISYVVNTAMSGSIYITTSKGEFRFSDHGRSATAKANFIYGESYTEMPSGLLLESEIMEAFEKALK